MSREPLLLLTLKGREEAGAQPVEGMSAGRTTCREWWLSAGGHSDLASLLPPVGAPPNRKPEDRGSPLTGASRPASWAQSRAGKGVWARRSKQKLACEIASWVPRGPL